MRQRAGRTRSEVLKLRPINNLDAERPTRSRFTGEQRPPRKGEWYTEIRTRPWADTALKAVARHSKKSWEKWGDPLPDIIEPL